MSDLLQIGATGVRAFNTAMAAISENVSNASTPGYTRRTVTLQEAPAAGNLNGVVVTSINRSWDDYRAAASRSAASDSASASAYYNWSQKVEDALSDDAAGVGQSATTIFTAADALAANPGDTSSRKAFLNAIGTTVDAFNTSAKSLIEAANDVAQAATTAVQSVNASLDNLDKINAALHQVRAGTSAQANLLDQRDALLNNLSTQIGIDVSVTESGAVTVKTAGGMVLTNPTGPGARLSIDTGADVDDGRITITAIGTKDETPLGDVGGNIGGLTQASDLIAHQRVNLDTLANSFATQINSWSKQGTDANNVAGADLVTGTGAAGLSLVSIDPTKVPAARDGASNGNLLQLSALRGDDGVEKQWAALVTDQGRTVDAAKTASDASSSRAEAAASALSDVTSVDLDTEAADLIRYQQAYSGAAKIIQAARDTMQALLNVI